MTKRYLRYALAVIFFANFLSYLDRQVVAALEHQLKHAFHLRTSEFGWVGSAFTVALRPMQRPADDIQIQGQIVRLNANGVTSFGVQFGKLDVAIEKKLRRIANG